MKYKVRIKKSVKYTLEKISRKSLKIGLRLLFISDHFCLGNWSEKLKNH